MTTPPTTVSVDELPGPRSLPLVGNLFDIDRADPLGGFVRMAEEYGPLFRLATPGGTRLLVSGPELVDEICDDTRFDKKVSGGLSNLRKGAADSGLFTSETDEPLWHRAHNILVPPFSLQSMRDYMPKMLDIADRHRPSTRQRPPGSRHRPPSPRPTSPRTGRRCPCCSAPTSAPPSRSPPGSRKKAPTAASPSPSARSTTTSTTCRAAVR
jgi:hypothetical protein